MSNNQLSLQQILLSNQFLPNLVKEVRQKLDEEFYIGVDKNRTYCGCCIRATELVIEECNRLKGFGLDIEAKEVHGELAHNPTINSKQWGNQHSMAKLNILGRTVYVDCTCCQFANVVVNIEDYYIGEKPPKWFYPDSRNPNYSRNPILRWINKKKIGIKSRLLPYGYEVTHYLQLIEFCQYIIWGKFSDFIRMIFYRKGRILDAQKRAFNAANL